MTVEINTKDANSILFIAGDILIKVYYLKEQNQFFLYYLNSIGIVPIKHTNTNHVSNLILENLPQNQDIDVRIRYSCYTSKKKKNQIQHLITQKDGINSSFSNILNILKLIS